MINTRIILLSAFLLLSQSGMLLHATDTEHAMEEHGQCEVCLSANGLDKTLTNATLNVVIYWWGNTHNPLDPYSSVVKRTSFAYQTRAPPFFHLT